MIAYTMEDENEREGEISIGRKQARTRNASVESIHARTAIF